MPEGSVEAFARAATAFRALTAPPVIEAQVAGPDDSEEWWALTDAESASSNGRRRNQPQSQRARQPRPPQDGKAVSPMSVLVAAAAGLIVPIRAVVGVLGSLTPTVHFSALIVAAFVAVTALVSFIASRRSISVAVLVVGAACLVAAGEVLPFIALPALIAFPFIFRWKRTTTSP